MSISPSRSQELPRSGDGQEGAQAPRRAARIALQTRRREKQTRRCSAHRYGAVRRFCGSQLPLPAQPQQPQPPSRLSSHGAVHGTRSEQREKLGAEGLVVKEIRAEDSSSPTTVSFALTDAPPRISSRQPKKHYCAPSSNFGNLIFPLPEIPESKAISFQTENHPT